MCSTNWLKVELPLSKTSTQPGNISKYKEKRQFWNGVYYCKWAPKTCFWRSNRGNVRLCRGLYQFWKLIILFKQFLWSFSVKKDTFKFRKPVQSLQIVHFRPSNLLIRSSLSSTWAYYILKPYPHSIQELIRSLYFSGPCFPIASKISPQNWLYLYAYYWFCSRKRTWEHNLNILFIYLRR